MVMADKIRLEQVLINLMRNALDATKDTPAPEVRIVATGGQSGRIVAVRDNGHGITNLDGCSSRSTPRRRPATGSVLALPFRRAS
jgi:two-component system, NtrC family, C4-dicarboxylate transport sensor histidine kinase DctB